MKRAPDATSSFDLFLDTICNTFGGIVFIAILLAVMVQNRALVVSEENAVGKPASAEQVRQAMASLAEVSTQQKLLAISLAAMPESYSTVDDTEFRQLREQQSELEEQIEAALEAEKQASATLAGLLEANAVQREENETVPQQLEELEELVAAAGAAYERSLDAKQQTLRVPRVRSSQSRSMLILVQDGSVFLAKKATLANQGFNTAQVSTNTRIDTGIDITPKSGTGYRLSGGDGLQEFMQLVREADSGGNSLTIAVWPDSFGQFAELRERMVQSGVFYQLWLQSPGEPLTVYMGSGSSSVQ